MKIWLEEKIGNPSLFTGRRKELEDLLTWTEKVKRKLSPSRALMSRRKTGKTALLQRLYNMVFAADEGVVPFYYEVKEENQWAIDFCQDFFCKFILQYIAFKSRSAEYIRVKTYSYSELTQFAAKESQHHLVPWIRRVSELVQKESGFLLWDTVRDAPRSIAEMHDERVIQIIDEFQYLNRKIYADRELTRLHGMARSYMSTAEYKNAPLLIAGSWVGLLMHDVLKMPGRFRIGFLENMPADEAVEMVYKYSLVEGIPVTDTTSHLIAELCEGSPFYISELVRSSCPQKDLTTPEGVLQTLEFETLDKRGSIRGTWMEYVQYAFSEVNERHAKNIVLYLCKHREREVTRAELLKHLKLEMTDVELEKKLRALVNADIIEQGPTNFDYHGVRDNIFDKVFRGYYQKEIRGFDPREITNEYKALFEKILSDYRRLSGERSHYKGKYAEFMIIQKLYYQAYKHNEHYVTLLHGLPADFSFSRYQSVWSWEASPRHGRKVQVDVFARAEPEHYSLIGEVKNRQTERYSAPEAATLREKAGILIALEQVDRAMVFVFSRSGFTQEALAYMEAQGMAWTDDERWIQESSDKMPNQASARRYSTEKGLGLAFQ